MFWMTAYLETLNHALRHLPESLGDFIPQKKHTPVPVNTFVQPIADMAWMVRLAGISGAAAVSLGAYGAHVIRDDPDMDPRRVKAFDTASRYHLIHSLAVLASPKAKYPLLTVGLFTGGILLFCGPCYHYSITGSENYRRITPKGGMLLILGWLSLIL